MSSGLFKERYRQTIHVKNYMYKQDVALSNLQGLIYH